MSLIRFYRGYILFKRNSGRIILSPMEETKLAALSSGWKYVISLNDQSQLEERIKSVIHELLHIGYEHRKMHFPETREIDNKIEEETKVLYRNPKVTKLVRDMLS